MHGFVLRCLCGVAIIGLATPAMAVAQERNFDLPSQSANKSIPEFARQAGIQIIAPGADLRGMRTPRLSGRYDVREALNIMLRGHDLAIAADDGTRITLASAARPLPAPRALLRRAAAPTPVRTAFLAADARIPSKGNAAPVPQDKAVASAGPEIGEILVTARRVEERSLTVPVTINAFSGDQLFKQQIRTSEDLATRVPALRIETDPTRTNDFQIRGVGRTFQGDSGVVTYIAEVPQQLFGSPPLYDLQSVQVLKGPQGTLFGKNTTGGAVLIEPKRPTADFGGFVTGRYGNYDAKELSAALNIPVSEMLQIRIAGQFTDRDGLQKNISGPDLDTQHRYSGRFSMTARPTEWLENYTMIDYYRSKEYAGVSKAVAVGSCPGSFVACLYSTGNSLGVPSLAEIGVVEQQIGPRGRDLPLDRAPSTIKGIGLTNHTTIEAGDVTIKNIFGYRHVRQNVRRDLDGVKAAIGDIPTYPEEKNQTTNELQARGSALDDKLRWVVGAYYSSHDAFLHGNQFGFLGDLPPSFLSSIGIKEQPSNNHNVLRTRTKALFAQGTYDLSAVLSGLQLTAGYRHTWEKRHFKGDAFQGLNPATRTCSYFVNGAHLSHTDPATCVRSVKLRYNAPNWNFNLEYAATPDLFLYATTRRGFKGGSFNVSARSESSTSYDPETLTDVEIGIKKQGRLGDAPYRFNLAIFKGWYKDQQSQQTFIPEGSGQFESLVVNASSANIKGFEFDATIEPVRGLTMGGFYAVTDGKYKKFGFQFAGTASDFSGLRLLNVPKVTASANIGYSYDAGADIGNFTANLYYNYTGSQAVNYVVQNEYSTIPSYYTLDASITWRDVLGKKAELRAYAKNFTNELNVIGGYDGRAGFGTATQDFAEPRTYGVELTIRF